jgi:hypothetical protein
MLILKTFLLNSEFLLAKLKNIKNNNLNNLKTKLAKQIFF